MRDLRLGVDLGGTKLEAAVLDRGSDVIARVRRPNPGHYSALLDELAGMVEALEAQTGAVFDRLGVGAPGSVSPVTGRMRNANSVWLNDRPLASDLEARLGRRVRLANDANCMALSETADGAGTGHRVVFAVIIGTGCGGGLTVDGRLVEGLNGVAGEWGHTPLPRPSADEQAIPPCWCGRRGCLETFLSGPALEADHRRTGGADLRCEAIAERAAEGCGLAIAALDRHAERLGRALAGVVNLLDPDMVVLAGGLSRLPDLGPRASRHMAAHVFSDSVRTPIRVARHGDASGVRGAAWLWPWT